MEAFPVNLYAFLGVLEFSLILFVIALIFIVRSKSLSGQVSALRKKLKKAIEQEAEPVSFDQYLRDEVIRNQEFVDRAAASEDDAEKKAAELMTMRKRFLELELSARESEKNPVEFQDKIAAGMSELIEQLRPEPETVAEVESGEADQGSELEQAVDEQEENRETIDTHDAEFDHLKQVINNQQDAMEALRSELKEREHEIENMDVVLQKLDEFDRQRTELNRCLEVLEQENQRLKQAKDAGEAVVPESETGGQAQLTGLTSMVGQQQETIGNLQSLINELKLEAGKAEALENAIESIRRNNQELNGCVSVLEDENAMLRSELEQIQTQLEDVEQPSQDDIELLVEPVADELETGDEQGVSPDEEKRELEIKVQELEALVEFKDAAIEELEKQYNKLEAKYLAATDEKNA